MPRCCAVGWMPVLMAGLLVACSNDGPTTADAEPAFTMTVSGPIDTTFSGPASFSLSGITDSALILRLMTYGEPVPSGVVASFVYTRAQQQYQLPVGIRTGPFARFFLTRPEFFGSDTFPIDGSLMFTEHTADRLRGSISFTGKGLVRTANLDTIPTSVEVSATFDAVYVR